MTSTSWCYVSGLRETKDKKASKASMTSSFWMDQFYSSPDGQQLLIADYRTLSTVH